ncbi:pimeloyl-[acyl-carrier protein] methyl ester esterase [Halomonas campaniensis]|uniref:Pimeloyl-[acyl-carrier protein] methyl ester esterase n=1 Tax=Halomonas campaniensis TaxID=213554 RepID=A0A7W5K6C2_9GAMM|nr:alpha/beta fold hydrolase [Halomonas campaniensis]MBB3332237.1 pimeloyl-[acyl-carrier protein] methyl ester esterase [Halomonas campaniensis]
MTRLVLLSGWGVDSRIWRPLAGHWPGGVTVTAPDWPGYGVRTPLAAPGSLAGLAEAMAVDLPADAVWVGWSLGGLLAGALLARLSPPRTLILLGMGTRFCDPEGVTRAELTAFRRAFARDPAATRRHFLRWQLGGEPDPRGAHRRLLDLIDDDVDPATLAAGLNQLAALDVSRVLADTPCPVKRLAGRHDPLLPPAAIAGADRVLDHAGHCPMLSRPAALAEALVALATDMRAARSARAEEAPA